jgi:hypothetical protein
MNKSNNDSHSHSGSVIKQLAEIVSDVLVSDNDLNTYLNAIKKLSIEKQIELYRIFNYERHLIAPNLNTILAISHLRLTKQATVIDSVVLAYTLSIDELLKQRDSLQTNDSLATDTLTRLQKFYLNDFEILAPSSKLIRYAENLSNQNFGAATVAFCASAVEVMIKNVLLRPTVLCSVGMETGDLPELIADTALSQTGHVRYHKILKSIFNLVVGSDISRLSRAPRLPPLLQEVKDLQNKRNTLLHRGEFIDDMYYKTALEITCAVHRLIAINYLQALNLTIYDRGTKIRIRSL